MKIVLATGNLHKRDELNKILSEHTLILPKDLGIDIDVEESGTTYIENSLIKAKELFKLCGGLPVLADDSGISVKALNGAPGVYSARYGEKEFGRELTASEKNSLLLKNMDGITDRSADFVCCMALILDENRIFTVQETFSGLVADRPYGNGGFGYDPVFFSPEFNKTAAELTDDEKNRVSHRGKAGKIINELLRSL
ncbi:MAG: RdgB/HAM1 family non-canonical purine NTP pyrophosphatase [Spirochaetales bacterium]|nr:RdgB/HAM1 family non-canonical purine NTP pyrophosphatase [Spirochaetales bacterium]